MFQLEERERERQKTKLGPAGAAWTFIHLLFVGTEVDGEARKTSCQPALLHMHTHPL